MTGEFFINNIQTVSAVHKLTTHKTHIKNIELIVLAKVGSLPVRELSIRNSKQPLLQGTTSAILNSPSALTSPAMVVSGIYT